MCINKMFLCLITCLLITVLSSCGLNNLPEGELQNVYTSADNKYEISIYLVNGGATVDYAIRGELKDLDTGKTKNIYWNYHEDKADVVWIDKNTVSINNHILCLPDDTYDFRKK